MRSYYIIIFFYLVGHPKPPSSFTFPSSKVIIMGTKRASPGAEDEKSPLQTAELNENAKKLEEIQRLLARAELVLGKTFRNCES